jgi:hypothetical protein
MDKTISFLQTRIELLKETAKTQPIADKLRLLQEIRETEQAIHLLRLCYWEYDEYAHTGRFELSRRLYG